jgi:hypothetical protein
LGVTTSTAEKIKTIAIPLESLAYILSLQRQTIRCLKPKSNFSQAKYLHKPFLASENSAVRMNNKHFHEREFSIQHLYYLKMSLNNWKL